MIRGGSDATELPISFYVSFVLLLIIILVVSRNMLEESEYQCLARHVSILFV